MTPSKPNLALTVLAYALLALAAVMALLGAVSLLFTLWNVGHLCILLLAQTLGFGLEWALLGSTALTLLASTASTLLSALSGHRLLKASETVHALMGRTAE